MSTAASDAAVAERYAVERLLRGLATLGAALMLIVIVSSAYLRLAQAGLSCADWPACYGRMSAHDSSTVEAPERVARLVHRIAASAVGAVLLALVLIAAAQRPILKRQTAIAGVGMLVAAGLAMLGARAAATGAVPLPAVTLANLSGGFALFALLWWLRLTTLPKQNGSALGWIRALAMLALGAAIAQILLGAMLSARFGALACPAFPACGVDAADRSLPSLLNPFTELAVANGAIVRPPALASLHLAHRLTAIVVLALVAMLVLASKGTNEHLGRSSAVVASLAVLQIALGAIAVLTALPLAIVVAHNLVAALLLAALVTVNARLASDRPGTSSR